MPADDCVDDGGTNETIGLDWRTTNRPWNSNDRSAAIGSLRGRRRRRCCGDDVVVVDVAAAGQEAPESPAAAAVNARRYSTFDGRL